MLVLSITSILVSSILISFSEIYFATKLDLKNTNINTLDSDSLNQAKQDRNFSLMFFILLIFSAVVGVLMVLLKIFGSYLFQSFYREYYSFVVLVLFSIIFFISNYFSYKRKLDYHIRRLVAWKRK